MKANNAAKNIQKYLDSHPNITQKDLAEKAKITQAALSQIISGHRIPSVPTTIKLLSAMKTKFEVLYK